jgi:transmembrane sensor
MDHSPNDDVAAAIVRVLSGDLPEREEIELRQWLDADPERRQLFHEMRAVWDEAAAAHGEWDTSALRERILATRKEREPQGTQQTHRARRNSPASGLARVMAARRKSTAVYALAAAVVLMVGAASWFAVRAKRDTVVAAPMREVSTKRGQRATVQLSDGSRITLGPASTVKYAERFAATGPRDVQLVGDAYFEVVHNEKRPFMVRTALGVARDLGTKFLVRAHEDVPYVDVVVVEGKVSLKMAEMGNRKSEIGRRDSVLLEPADLGRLDAAGNLGVERKTDLSGVLAWMRGQLVFKNAAVSEVVAEIERSYDVNVRIGDPLLRDLRFSGSFGAQPATDVVASFARAIGATAEKDNGGFVLVRRGDR